MDLIVALVTTYSKKKETIVVYLFQLVRFISVAIITFCISTSTINQIANVI
jgi:hypothetical protein